jgi:hypothetical protein
VNGSEKKRPLEELRDFMCGKLEREERQRLLDQLADPGTELGSLLRGIRESKGSLLERALQHAGARAGSVRPIDTGCDEAIPPLTED